MKRAIRSAQKPAAVTTKSASSPTVIKKVVKKPEPVKVKVPVPLTLAFTLSVTILFTESIAVTYQVVLAVVR